MRLRDLGFLCVVVGAALAMGRGFIRSASPTRGPVATAAARPEISARVDQALREGWRAKGTVPAPTAPDLAVMRRLNLALAGAVPSLEEVRRFEAMPAEGRVGAWADELLRDRRTADYLA